VIRTLCAIVLCLGLVACGGGGGNSTTVNPPPTPTPPPAPTPNPVATTPPSPPVLVQAQAGATGVNIIVPGASQTPPSNAQFLGVAAPGSTSVTLFSTGDVIHQGATSTVLVAGPGISATSTVRISGPVDITAGPPRGIRDANNNPTPGLAVDLVVSPTAVLGARTVFIISGNDMTTFTGGLEVVQ
jgi:hypothetical protein